MLQGVREVFDITDLDAAASGEGKGGKLVLIGRGLRRGDVEGSLARALRGVE